MMTPHHFNVRSIMAEAILNREGAPNFRACGTGSHPVGQLDPYAIQIESPNLPTEDLRSCSPSATTPPRVARARQTTRTATEGTREQIRKAFVEINRIGRS